MDLPTRSFPALGTVAVVAVTEPAALTPVVAMVRDEIAACDVACSRFRPDSDLSRLNAAGGRTIAVSARLIDDLGAAVRAARLTDGIVDPTIGNALVSLGYDRDFEAVAGGERPGLPLRGPLGPGLPLRGPLGPGLPLRGPLGPGMITFAPVPGWTTVYTDRAGRRAHVPAGVMLDLGSTAKARCADLAAAAAATATGCGVLVSLGGDVAVAGPPPPEGWAIHVTDDARASQTTPGQTIAVQSGGLATSGTTVRSWRRGGARLHHLIDPRTGVPAPVVWRTVTVAAATCLDANTASTAAVILGAAAPGWLAEIGLAARLVRRDGTVTCLGGWPTGQTPVLAGSAA